MTNTHIEDDAIYNCGFHAIISDQGARIAEQEEEIASLRKEITRLHTIISNQRAGYENASPAGLGMLAERARQQRLENYDNPHDDELSEFQLSKAATAYMMDAIERALGGEGFVTPPDIWPWERDSWKRKPIHRQIEVAGALLIAEQDRIQRNGLEDIF